MFQRLIARISESHTRWIAWGMAVGVLSGLSAALFFVALEYATHLTMHELVGAAPPAPPGDVFFPPSGEPAAAPRRWLTYCRRAGRSAATRATACSPCRAGRVTCSTLAATSPSRKTT